MKVLAIDFDDTIANRSKTIKEGDCIKRAESLIHGAKEFIDSMKLSFKIIIFSARTDTTREFVKEKMEDMTKFLDNNNIYYDYILQPGDGKMCADYYIDDKAIRFENNWDEIKVKIKESRNDRK